MILTARLGSALQKLPLVPFAFRVYQRLSAMEPRAFLRNRPRRVAPDGLPVPPARLLMTVAGTPEPHVFLDGGEQAAAGIREILEKNGILIENLGAILDFGCGCGRVLRFWSALPVPELHGTDYNPELTAWCAANLPFAAIGRNRLGPPANYPPASFDLIYGLSVFTHLPEELQLGWMREFHRILRPGGLLLLSMHGAHYLPRLNAEEQRCFLAGNLVTRFDRSPGTNLCSVFHPEAYVRRTWMDRFEVIDFLPEGARGNPRQDLWLFKRA